MTPRARHTFAHNPVEESLYSEDRPFMSLREAALEQGLAGVTTLEEVVRVTQVDTAEA
jgi:type II secretory ATPase GspE/PulE/Tfp pilus assembly ATPase PilB-like protein